MNQQTALPMVATIAQELDVLERLGANEIRQYQPGAPGVEAVVQRIRRMAAISQRAVTEVEEADRWLLPEQADTDPIEQALKLSSEAHLQALGQQSGLPISALALLQSWMELTLGARALQQRIDEARAGRSALGQTAFFNPPLVQRDPIAALTAVELGRELGGISDETVRNHEKAGRLFSILRPGRQRGREYPAFQAWPGVAGAPLASVLARLGLPQTATGADAYGFFTSPSEFLGQLSPIEVLIQSATSPRALGDAAQLLLSSSASDRLATVERAAEAYAAQVAA